MRTGRTAESGSPDPWIDRLPWEPHRIPPRHQRRRVRAGFRRQRWRPFEKRCPWRRQLGRKGYWQSQLRHQVGNMFYFENKITGAIVLCKASNPGEKTLGFVISQS